MIMEKEKHVKGKQSFTLLVILLLAAVLSACGGTGSKKQGSPEVYLGGEVVEKGDKIIIKGESNLLEGSRVDGVVRINEDEVFADTTEVTDKKGNFTMELDHPEYGDAVVAVTFNLDGMQEEEIMEHYGENGSKLEGPYTYVIQHWDFEDLKQEARAEITISEDDSEKKHEFAAPEWKKRPKDYGDPRIWLEVTEMTNDDEYFYIEGESNFIEGTLLKAEHRNNASTIVNPDGTFDFKLEYSYEEDKPIVIVFRPFNQWGNVLKQYGENGEKLVGNLVVRDGNYLFIEYPYEYEE